MRLVRPSIRSVLLPLVGATLAALSVAPPASAKSLGWNADSLALELNGIAKLPATPEGVTDLKFSEFFRTPVGPRGLEFSEKLQSLAGQRVRVLGFMARQSRPSPGVAILASYAFATHEGEYGLCDDLPPALVFVEVPKYRDLAVPFTPGPLLLTGTLELGAKEEADGRVSLVRLRLDPAAAAAAELPTSNIEHPTPKAEGVAVTAKH